ncbi:10323_t:CDS:1 [Dentiscutata heterogama]|uniref:10323_t:CDS:1 n=1 Tax=Dentiscutata heterogama TaxID=1316150 RepID=A0ACA9MGV1_9GLOM|nr:10323_t:CDS:1 [Dentiscutata heterogama]
MPSQYTQKKKPRKYEFCNKRNLSICHKNVPFCPVLVMKQWLKLKNSTHQILQNVERNSVIKKHEIHQYVRNICNECQHLLQKICLVKDEDYLPEEEEAFKTAIIKAQLIKS